MDGDLKHRPTQCLFPRPKVGQISLNILVPENSSVQKLTDLKGKKVAFQKGSSAHLLLVQALEKAGLKYTDIEPKSENLGVDYD